MTFATIRDSGSMNITSSAFGRITGTQTVESGRSPDGPVLAAVCVLMGVEPPSLAAYSRGRRDGGFSRSSGRNDTPARSRASDARRRASSCRCSCTRNGASPGASGRRR